MPRVLVVKRLPRVPMDRLGEAAEIDLYDGDGDMPRAELLERVGDADALVSLVTTRVDAELLDSAPRLKVVANVAVGYDNIDLEAASSRGVVVTNTPDVLTNAVADFTLGLILTLVRRIAEGDRLVRAGRWTGWALDFMLGHDLRGKRLGIVGRGRIGHAVAERAAAFGMEVVFASARGRQGPDTLTLDQLLASSDVVSLHVPLAPETRHLIGQRELARMKRTAVLVNTSRGPVVDEAALVWALEEHRIGGAALDVYEREPEVTAALLGFENVVLAPHLGSATVETRTAMADLAVRNVIAVLSGAAPLTPV
ncbi:MAG: D-glycerate dehydrogenase [Vicinamibacteraceae bacterium]|nr:D-glycerate dehydrogenase [Vicinamibacteraceae bacterium]